MVLIDAEHKWIFGMLLNICGSVLVNFGTNLMKYAHNVANRSVSSKIDPDSLDRGLYKSNFIWKVGMFAFVFGSIVNFISFAFAAQSLLACLGAVQFISNVFFAKFVLKETLTPRIICATVVIIVGLTLAILCSNHATLDYEANDLEKLYTINYLYFVIETVFVLGTLQLTYLYYVKRAAKGNLLPGHKLVVPCCYALVSAIVGTQSVLQSKCLAELLKATIAGHNQFDHGVTYVILVLFLFGMSFWLYRMNQALKMFDGLLIIPLLQVCWTTSAILQGGVYFQEFEKLSSLQTSGFAAGICIVFLGVYVLVPPDSSSSSSNYKHDIDLNKNGSVDDIMIESQYVEWAGVAAGKELTDTVPLLLIELATTNLQ